MIDFKKKFRESNTTPSSFEYKDRHIIIGDRFPVKNKDILILSIESTNSKYFQGVSVGVYGSCKVLGKTYKKGKFSRILFWEESDVLDPKYIEIQIFTKESYVFIQNIWEAESSPPYAFKEGELKTNCAGSAEWEMSGRWNGAAMYTEEIEEGRRYFCNDGDRDEDFDDIIFTVRKKNTTESV